MAGALAKPIYNQAYQENYDADDINDIVVTARNAYVLVDPYMTGIPDKIELIQSNGNEVGGYISIGTGEDWRSDFEQLKPFLVEKEWGKWPGEYFVNQTTTGVIPIMKARIDQLADWGCDWVEFDNMDWVFDDELRDQYSIKVTIEEGIDYYNELCDYAHSKGIKCMAKNTVHQADNFDGVLYESFHNDKNWWNYEEALQFLNREKLFIINHYKECTPNKVYTEYIELYNNNISFICESKKTKNYIHFNQ